MSPDAEAVALSPPFALTTPPTAAKNEYLVTPPLAADPGNIMREFMAITKALADENRVRFLLALQDRELCLCQIVELAGLAPSTVSKHMTILKQARLVESRKDGRWMYYRLPDRDAPPAVRRTVAWVAQSLADDPQIAADRKRLEKVLKLIPQALCEAQCSHARKSST